MFDDFVINVGLSKPAPEHIYAMVDRDFLCDPPCPSSYSQVTCQTHTCGKGCLLKPRLDYFSRCCDNIRLLIYGYMLTLGHLTWFHRYKYNRTCALYIFFFNTHFYIPVKPKHLSGHKHMYKLENAITPEQMSYDKSFLWDTVHFEWNSMHLHMNGQPVNLPSSITIPLKDKIRAWQVLAKEDLDPTVYVQTRFQLV